jgi:hypothetical protein
MNFVALPEAAAEAVAGTVADEEFAELAASLIS